MNVRFWRMVWKNSMTGLTWVGPLLVLVSSPCQCSRMGAFARATVGWFDFANKSYKEIEIREQCEVLSATVYVAGGEDEKGEPSCSRCTGAFGWLNAWRRPPGRHRPPNPRSR